MVCPEEFPSGDYRVTEEKAKGTGQKAARTSGSFVPANKKFLDKKIRKIFSTLALSVYFL
jgi:hypothetical protein